MMPRLGISRIRYCEASLLQEYLIMVVLSWLFTIQNFSIHKRNGIVKKGFW